MKYGYMGKILMVDLSRGIIEVEKIPDDIYEKYSSGVGLASYLLYNRIPAGADPLGPDNIIGFVSGLLTGSKTFFTGRWMVVGKSPLTLGWGDANSGGRFSHALKKSGYDAIFFKGISPEPVYLLVNNGKAELKSAAHLWGMDISRADNAIKAETGSKIQTALIGPAGEKLSLISGIATDKARFAARSGLGAVMGSKRLKGLAATGKQKINIANPARVSVLNREFKKWFDKGQWLSKCLTPGVLKFMGKFMRMSPVAMAQSGLLTKTALKKYGTCVTDTLSSESGDSPVKNWNGAGCSDYPVSSHAEAISPEKIIKYQVKKYHCYSCPIGCGGILEVTDGPYPLSETHKPEYESICAFGPLILNKNLHVIIKINDMLNRAGMDTISAGATIAWATECYENSIVSLEELDGIDLSWGNTEAVLLMVEKMIRRDGIGDILADGCKKAAEKLGKGREFAMHAGGQELPMHDSRFDPGFAVSYALEPTPGRHTNHGYQWLEMFALDKIFDHLSKLPVFSFTRKKYREDKKQMSHMVAASKYMQFVNSVGCCLFGVQMDGRLNLVEYTNAVTGWDRSPEEYLKIGERIQNIRQAFNLKHHIRPLEDFALPQRTVGGPPLGSGPLKDVRIDTKALYKEFLRGMGWEETTAVPTREKLQTLELDFIISNKCKGDMK